MRQVTHKNEKTDIEAFSHLYFTALDSTESIPKKNTSTALDSWE